MSLQSPSTYDQEKGADSFAAADALRSDQYAGGLGDLQVLKTSESGGHKLAKDGKTVLIPQPSDDPNDPLNWSFRKKHLVFLSLAFASLLTDFGMTWGTVLYAAQAPDFHMSTTATANSVSGGIFLQGVGGLLSVPLVQRFGRLPVLFWSQLLTALAVMGAALSPDYASFTACRALQGIFNTAPQVVGLSVVHDMFFFHERTRRVNIWVFLIMGGPYIGPFISAWINTAVNWQSTYGVLVGLHGFSTLIIIFLGAETFYDRRRSDPMPPPTGLLGHCKTLVGWTGFKAQGRPSPRTVFKDMLAIQVRPQVFLVITVYVMVLVAWVIGVNTTVSLFVIPPPYSFSGAGQACSWLAPLIGAIIGYWWGHWFNDWLCARYVRAHNGVYVLESRLWGAWAPTLTGIVGLVLYGQSLQHALHWAVLLVAWAMIGFSIISATTAVSAYCLDCFPNHASLVAAIINMWRTTGGFCVVYFQVKWANTSGPGVSFGCQAMLLGVAFLVGVVVTQIKGRDWRLKYPPPKVED